ncbi:MAG: nucleotide sugar dehydrogenase [Gammaproteobacteria bacterium]|nr:nucleotide sugar dehydrogenase [Gammaproteobacteria bacterium]
MRTIAVVGLGYVGLPLALIFAKKFKTIGYDNNSIRIKELKNKHDRTLEVFPEDLASSTIELTDDPKLLSQANFYIVTVPTPIDNNKNPDLTALLSASETVGLVLKKGDLVVYESTVYPGATEEDCAPVLEKFSGLKSGIDFKLGYSPERINPGDKIHTLDKVVKIVSGQDREALQVITETYGAIITAGLYKAESIKIAEAAKIIENTQRDLNIALMNELAIIFNKLNIDTNKVIDAASTKWNFMPVRPGLVGGHCIGVDPYYLIDKAEKHGIIPNIIKSARAINDSMGVYVANLVIEKLKSLKKTPEQTTIAILGLTFKENCSDLRNSRSVELVGFLQAQGYKTIIHDPEALEEEVNNMCNLELTKWENVNNIDAMVISVAHNFYKELQPKDLLSRFKDKALIMDVKSVLNSQDCKDQGIILYKL